MLPRPTPIQHQFLLNDIGCILPGPLETGGAGSATVGATTVATDGFYEPVSLQKFNRPRARRRPRPRSAGVIRSRTPGIDQDGSVEPVW
jgi:hypothetical protein